MKPMKRTAALMMAAAMLLTLLCACGGGEETPEGEQFALRVCVQNEPDVLDPAMVGATGKSIMHHLFENLMRLSDDGDGVAKIDYGIASGYTVTENEDGTETYVFNLRETARWSDGTKLTASDFVFAWRRLANPKTESPHHTLLSGIVGYDEVREGGDTSALAVSAENKYTFSVTLKSHDPYFLENVCTAAATMPLRRSIVEDGSTAWSSGVGTFVSNGPYMLERWKHGESMELCANEGYHEAKRLGPDTIRFVFASDAAAYELYQNGDVDFVEDLPEDVLRELSMQEDWTATPLAATYTVLINNLASPLDIETVREAFALSIDCNAAVEAAEAGSVAAVGLVPYGIADGEDSEEDFRTVGGELHGARVEDYAENCSQARLRMSGTEYPGGQGFPPIEYIYEAGGANDAVAKALQAMWKDAIGVNVVLRGVSAEELETALSQKTYQLAGLRIGSAINDAFSFLGMWRSDSAENYISYSNETYDVLLGVAENSLNSNARAAFMHDAEMLLIEDEVLLPIYYYASSSLLREELAGVYCDVMGNYYFRNVHEVKTENTP